MTKQEVRQLRRDLRQSDLRLTLEMFRGVRRDVKIARSSLEKRLDLLNELRGNVITREEYQAKHDAIEAEVQTLRDRINSSAGGGRALDKLGYYILGGGVLILGVIEAVRTASGH